MASAADSSCIAAGEMLAQPRFESKFPLPWPEAKEGKKKVLIIISHPNTGKSFNHKLVEAAKATLEADGHAVIVNDLVENGFNPTTGKHDFTSLKDPDSFDLQTEQVHTVESGGKFAPDLQEQLDLVDWCDIIIHQFPMYWWSVPAIHKGWIDRCLVYHYAYPPHVSKWTGKQWMMSVTVGPDPEKATSPPRLSHARNPVPNSARLCCFGDSIDVRYGGCANVDVRSRGKGRSREG